MSWGDPARSELLLDFEAVYATDPSTAAAKQMPFDSCGLGVDQAPIEVDTLGEGASPSKPVFGNKDANGPIIIPVDKITAGWWLKMLTGTPQTTGSADPYTHVFKIVTTTAPPSAVIDVGHPDLTLYYKYNGCMLNTLSIDFMTDPLVINLGILASYETKGTSAYDASPSDLSKIGTRFSSPDLTIKEGGSSITTIERATLNIDNRLDSAFCGGNSGKRSDCQRTKVRVYGNIVGLFDSDALLLKGRDHTESSLEFILTSSTHSLTFKVPELFFSQRKPPVEGPRGLRMNLDYAGYYEDGADASAVKITLVNATATYA